MGGAQKNVRPQSQPRQSVPPLGLGVWELEMNN